MKKTYLFLCAAALTLSGCCGDPGKTVALSADELMDRIKGGWAAQTFACTYGGPTEFKYRGIMIDDSVAIEWPDSGYCRWYYENRPGLYDDIYMDLTFVDVIDRLGADAPVDSFAMAFANAEYMLWHANQAARYNILNGIMPPESGNWRNNPHAEDIDFQIEADFAGLMNPGMPLSAGEMCDRVGHIMCSGDGYYGGLYVAAMYSLAFVHDDVRTVVTKALKMIPEQSSYHRCISDVIRWCGENSDWRQTWQCIQDNWSYEINCPHGIEDPFNIDAKLNSAYVVVGLLYGNGDMERTIDIATRCGADSDCNPATAGGILGTMLGYSNISDKWLRHIREVEDMPFAYTDISLNKAYGMSFRHALDQIVKNGGKAGEKVVIKVQKPAPVPMEKCFEGLELKCKSTDGCNDFSKPYTLSFDGCGIVCEGYVRSGENCHEDYVAMLEVTVDGNVEEVSMPVRFAVRRLDMYWNYSLVEGEHELSVRWLNPVPYAHPVLTSVIQYGSTAK
ncbi:MAG: ADP-ribosylglycohydrolase family protein [Paraprevotella sp.]|nr:ADP-ribosylglycohydrolase family protein [Paraprevotella sp.]